MRASEHVRTMGTMRLKGFIVLAVVAAAALAPWGVAPVPAVDVDPQSLVGEWQGLRTLMKPEFSSPQTSQWSLVIEKVEGNKVHLRREMPGARTVSYVGTLTGDQLTFGEAASPITFTIDGNRMTSKFRLPRGDTFEYDLRKK